MITGDKTKEGISYARQRILNISTQYIYSTVQHSAADDEPHGAQNVASDKEEYFFEYNCTIVVMCDAKRTR
jgi:hypothetical protein